MEKSPIASRISFKEVRALAANEGWGKRSLDQLDLFLGAAILLTPAVLGPPGFIALSFLEPKSELIKIGRALIERLSKPSTEDFVARRRRMTAAYCLMTYTAFFAALDAKYPEFAAKVALSEGRGRCPLRRWRQALRSDLAGQRLSRRFIPVPVHATDSMKRTTSCGAICRRKAMRRCSPGRTIKP